MSHKCHTNVNWTWATCLPKGPGGSKQIIKMAKKTFTEKMGMKKMGKREIDSEDALYEISRCNSYDFDTGITGRDSDTVFFKERHLVPAEVMQAGLARFNLMLDMNAPGTVPDPLLIAALIDLVRPSKYLIEPLTQLDVQRSL